MTKVLFLSIQPKFAERILRGLKTVELRRIRPSISKGDKVLLYVSSPTMALTAISTVEAISFGKPNNLWKQVKEIAGVSHSEYQDYFSGAEVAVAIHIKDVHELPQPISLKKLREVWPGFVPPQSYRYFSDDQIAQIFGARSKIMQRANRIY
jgi:predicted transcriptional regulator